MAWGKLDDRMPFHPKIIAAGNEAIGARDRMIAWSCGKRTDGWVPYEIVKAICGRPGLIRHMVEVGVLDCFEETPVKLQGNSKERLTTIRGKHPSKNKLSFRVHNHLKWNPSAEESDAISKSRSEAGTRGAAAKWGKTDGNGHDKTIADPDPDPDPIVDRSGSDPNRLMLGDINDALEQRLGPRGFISVKWQPKLRPHLPYTPAELESAIMEATAADGEPSGGLVASILIRYRKSKRTSIKPPLGAGLGRGKSSHLQPMKRPEWLPGDPLPEAKK